MGIRLDTHALARFPIPTSKFFNLPPSNVPPPADSTIPGVLTPEQFEALRSMYVCPHWQRLNVKGMCVDEWWVGPPASWVSAALATGVVMGVVGYLVVGAARIKRLRPIAKRAQKILRLPDWAEVPE